MRFEVRDSLSVREDPGTNNFHILGKIPHLMHPRWQTNKSSKKSHKLGINFILQSCQGIVDWRG